MSIPNSKRLEIARRRQAVATLTLRGWTQSQIAHELAVGQATVSSDLKAVRQEWREAAIHDFDLLSRAELLKLDLIERESWLAWERSQKPQQSAEVAGEHGRPTRKRVRNQYGDPRFLTVINQTIANRRAWLGVEGRDPVGLPLPVDQAPAFHEDVALIPRELNAEECLQIAELLERAQRRAIEDHSTIPVVASPSI